MRDTHTPYKVVLVPADDNGVHWLATFSLLGVTLILFAAWGSAMFYNLTASQSKVSVLGGCVN